MLRVVLESGAKRARKPGSSAKEARKEERQKKDDTDGDDFEELGTAWQRE